MPINLSILNKEISISPLVNFRILLGLLLLFSTVRFYLNGWIESCYINVDYHFTFWGFSWVSCPSASVLYAMYITMAIAAIFICIGFLYRWACAIFFLLFTYIELIDKTYYLNHYYFVSLVVFLMIFIPANAQFSLDCKLGFKKEQNSVRYFYLGALQMQLAVVYFFAGIAKINYDWLMLASPMRLWLPPHEDFFILGPLFKLPITAFIFSWAGMLYDIFIPFLLWNKRTRLVAFTAVLGFHLITSALFPIGIFPYVMILSCSIFFSTHLHDAILNTLKRLFSYSSKNRSYRNRSSNLLLKRCLMVFFGLQLILPFRYLVLGGNLFWDEMGYRFSWRVMLMEKAGYAQFTVKDPETGRTSEIENRMYLTPLQEKMMSTQADMILQFAHHIRDQYKLKGINDPIVHADVQLSLNGRRSEQFVDPSINLAAQNYSYKVTDWILPYPYKN